MLKSALIATKGATNERSDAQIRRKQVEKALAISGDITMLISLGKQRLGQRDKQEVEMNWPEKGYGGLSIPRREAELGTTDKPNQA